MTSHHSELTDLRMQNLTRSVQSIMVFAAAIFANAFLPQLIITYMYTQEELLTLTEQPKILELLPIATFAISAIYFLYVVFTSIMNNRKAAVLKQEMSLGGCCGNGCCDTDEELSDSELKELESIVEEALKPKKSTKKSSVKKSAKKSTK
ncbi:MAG: hypothetical protein GW762_03770 [Candidatus Pacebacteria bacterium]|nr:hypothetical protein [Candidatus Paceibacterota bacterium]PIR63806.1 MAG: hypothetical protein COU64_02440 [Candidatus Pacebacteria bacterium CG10_big_fil_rev_8_21_14_0_10_40_26]PIZ78593.1 MAG: hypothetical protein COY01_05115 [Candidatus Pacebacteria bacterium CG_4_10_14_0_2_um_filter_40_20]PJA69444.1 MAG: hypothetical protein CO156_01005 [Candidatus Pacebacteria bacterium CG_4_9_14_3_um_filter_40_12]PJC41461.1 MAG: hypothetical protein CO041_04990 [Candidatus Pacebacteria bacterium CG_4_9_